jgi:4-hydroxybenzoate polyprenyltransferase
MMGQLTARAVHAGALVAVAALLGLAAAAGPALDLPLLPAWAAAWAALAWGYSAPIVGPARRGHGEVWQGLGYALLLATGYAVQHPAGGLAAVPWAAAGAVYLLGWAGHVATALPDAPSDRTGGKRTYPVRFGDAVARRHALTATLLAALVALLAAPLRARGPLGAAAVAAATALVVLATLALRWTPYLLRAPGVAEDPLACALTVAAVAAIHLALLGTWVAVAAAAVAL